MKSQKSLLIFPMVLGSLLLILISCEKENDPEPPTISTLSVIEITTHTAQSGGNIIDDGGDMVTSRGLVWSTLTEPSLEQNEGLTIDGSGSGLFQSQISGLHSGTKYFVRAYATNTQGVSYGQQESFKTVESGANDGEYGEGVTDINGNFYNSIYIGNQEWMAENLRVTKYNNGDMIYTGLGNNDWGNTNDGAYCIFPYDYVNGVNSVEEMVEAYGVLYNWYAVNDPRGLCPDGWQVPSDENWEDLLFYLSEKYGIENINTSYGAGNILKGARQINHPWGGENDTETHPRWDENSTHFGLDDFNFSAFPAGRRYYTGSHGRIGENGNFWTTTEEDEINAIARGMINRVGAVTRSIELRKATGLSIRCIRINH